MNIILILTVKQIEMESSGWDLKEKIQRMEIVMDGVIISKDLFNIDI